MTLRYSLAAGACADADQASAFAVQTAAATSHPLVGVVAAAHHDREFPTEWSLPRVSDDRVRLLGLTTPKAGTLLVRFRSVANEPITCDVDLTLGRT